MKKRLSNLIVFLLLVFGLPTGLFAQDLIPKSGEHITISLKAEDWAVITPENTTRWFEHLDVAYELYQALTGYTPYAMAPYYGHIYVESRDYVNGFEGLAGNPIQWLQSRIHDYWVTQINDSDDWCSAVLHEVSHDFDKDVWNFHGEALATFKQLFVYEMIDNVYGQRMKATHITKTNEDSATSDALFTRFGIIYPKVEYTLLKLHDQLGWEPFKLTFRALTNTPDPGSQYNRFMLFLDTLDQNTDASVYDLIPISELNQLKHYFLKGSLGDADQTNCFIQNAKLKATVWGGGQEIHLAWNNYFDNEDGYELEYSTDNANFQLLKRLDQKNSHEYTVSSLPLPGTYYFRVRAYNDSPYYRGYSLYSAVAVITPADIPNMAFNKQSVGGVEGAGGSLGAELAVDGNTDTYWSSGCDSKISWLKVDLGEYATADKIIVKHYVDIHDPSAITRAFAIQKSFDGNTWQEVQNVPANTAAITEINLATAQNARFWRLYITQPRQDTGTEARILEFQVFRATQSLVTNVALNKPVQADTSFEVPELAVDGRVANNSKWCAGGAASEHWLKVDLGQDTVINAFIVKHAGVMETDEYNTSDYVIEKSMDGISWTIVDYNFMNGQAVTYHLLPAPISTRYLRLHIIKGTLTSDYTTRIYEFQALKFTESITPPGNLAVSYMAAETNNTTNTLRLRFQLANTGTTPINLANVKIRYWYTMDGTEAQNYACDWAALGNYNITGQFTDLVPAKAGADNYFDIGFTANAGTLAPGASSGEIQIRIWKTNWANYNQANDYSFNASLTAYGNNQKVGGYLNNVLVFGIAP